MLRASFVAFSLLGVSLEEELTSNVRLSTMANLKAEFHEHLTRLRGVYYDKEMNTCLLESHLEIDEFTLEGALWVIRARF